MQSSCVVSISLDNWQETIWRNCYVHRHWTILFREKWQGEKLVYMLSIDAFFPLNIINPMLTASKDMEPADKSAACIPIILLLQCSRLFYNRILSESRIFTSWYGSSHISSSSPWETCTISTAETVRKAKIREGMGHSDARVFPGYSTATLTKAHAVSSKWSRICLQSAVTSERKFCPEVNMRKRNMQFLDLI